MEITFSKHRSTKLRSGRICLLLASFAFNLLTQRVYAEESSIMVGATTITTEDSADEPSINAIDDAYNYGYRSDLTNNHAGKKEWRVKLASEKTIVSWFLQYEPTDKDNFGKVKL